MPNSWNDPLVVTFAISAGVDAAIHRLPSEPTVMPRKSPPIGAGYSVNVWAPAVNVVASVATTKHT